MGKTALIVIDMITTYDHADADLLLPSAREVVPAAAGLLQRARGRNVPVVYVNDNFGEWRSHHGELLGTALSGPHADLVELLRARSHPSRRRAWDWRSAAVMACPVTGRVGLQRQ